MPEIGFDDLEVGQRLEVGRIVVTTDDAIEFARRWEPQPYHVDPAAAAESIFGGLTLCSLQLFAICTRLFFDWPDRIAVLAMLGKDAIRLPNPARPDEEIVYHTQCAELRPSRSKPDRGVVTLHDTLSNAAGDSVLTQSVTLLVPRTPG